MTLNSRTWIKTNINQQAYSTSESGSEDVYDWIQDPISCQPFEFTRKPIIIGIYAQAGGTDFSLPLTDTNLNQEFMAWEAASDEALMNN
ncbi:MAG: hypothetical protein IMZ61_02010 [Planctomycetes bacterium]|nr:hypothetical protein [Planctomycetota bacterium]